MRIALLMHPYNLGFRGKWTWDDLYNDPRGMSGSELGFVEIAKGLVELGHDVVMFTDSDIHTFQHHWATHSIAGLSEQLSTYPGHYVLPWNFLEDRTKGGFDLAIAINHPGGLEHFDCPKVCLQWLNSFEYMTRDEFQQVDLWLSPSEAHREFILNGGEHQLADGYGILKPNNIDVLPLGCTPELYHGIEKVPGRVIYASSPDRGLHHLLQAWPSIKRRAPHAHLKIYYRILPWIAEMKSIPEPFPPCEENRQRALFIEDALRRLSNPKWGVEVVGPVSRNGITRAMGEAECLAYPVDTMRFSEGFSVTTLEACAAGTRPVIFDCDALGSIYGDVADVQPRGNVEAFAKAVSWHLENSAPEHTPRLKTFARNHTWRRVCEQLLSKTHGLMAPAASSVSENSASIETRTAASPT